MKTIITIGKKIQEITKNNKEFNKKYTNINKRLSKEM